MEKVTRPAIGGAFEDWENIERILYGNPGAQFFGLCDEMSTVTPNGLLCRLSMIKGSKRSLAE